MARLDASKRTADPSSPSPPLLPLKPPRASVCPLGIVVIRHVDRFTCFLPSLCFLLSLTCDAPALTRLLWRRCVPDAPAPVIPLRLQAETSASGRSPGWAFRLQTSGRKPGPARDPARRHRSAGARLWGRGRWRPWPSGQLERLGKTCCLFSRTCGFSILFALRRLKVPPEAQDALRGGWCLGARAGARGSPASCHFEAVPTPRSLKRESTRLIRKSFLSNATTKKMKDKTLGLNSSSG